MHIENCPICSRLMCDLFVGIAPPVQHIQVNCFSLLLYSVVWPLSDMNFFSHISFDERVQCATGLLVCGIRNFKSSRISFFFFLPSETYIRLYMQRPCITSIISFLNPIYIGLGRLNVTIDAQSPVASVLLSIFL